MLWLKPHKRTKKAEPREGDGGNMDCNWHGLQRLGIVAGRVGNCLQIENIQTTVLLRSGSPGDLRRLTLT